MTTSKTSLYELTKEDWNTLFPVELIEHDPNWTHIYATERQRIRSYTDANTVLTIEHFGSSSIPHIKAKPYIDMLIDIPAHKLFDINLIDQFEALGYAYFKVPQRDHIDAYMSFGKGYHIDGRKDQVFHIHMCPRENIMWEQLKFRDHLRTNTRRAKEYEHLKIKLAEQFRNDRGAYVLGKNNFIQETMDLIHQANI